MLPTSSATSNAPCLSIATPTGRPIASPLSVNPVRHHSQRAGSVFDALSAGADAIPPGSRRTLRGCAAGFAHDGHWRIAGEQIPKANRGHEESRTCGSEAPQELRRRSRGPSAERNVDDSKPRMSVGCSDFGAPGRLQSPPGVSGAIPGYAGEHLLRAGGRATVLLRGHRLERPANAAWTAFIKRRDR